MAISSDSYVQGNLELYGEIYNIGETTAKFYADLYGADKTFKGYRYIKLEIDGKSAKHIQSNDKCDGTNGDTSVFEYTITGLTPGTTYKWKATLGWHADGGEREYSTSAILSGKFTTTVAISIIPWSWETSDGNSSNEDRQRAYSILIGKAPLDDGFSHKVWNDFVDKVDEVCSFFGDGWDTADGDYYSASACKVSSQQTLSAKIYNSIKYQIDLIKDTGISDVKANFTKLTGNSIIDLADTLNSIIG